MHDPKKLNRRHFTQISTASALGATAIAAAKESGATTAGNSASKSAQIQPVGGRDIDSTAKKVPLAPPDKQPPNLELPSTPSKKIGYAIVGLGQLSLGQILPAFGQCEFAAPVALVSGHPDKAKTVAKAYGIESDAIYNYDNCDQIANDDRIDIVYIVLPNSMHAEFTIRALEAGKHVLCEKPMASTIDECERMIEAAKKADRKLMIAYRLHYEPFNQKVMQMCDEKRFGQIKTFSGSFCINVTAPNIRLSSKLAGGPVGDVGVYPINASRYVTGEEPMEVFAQSHQPTDDSRFREVPESVSCLLRFPSGVLANIDCSFGTHRSDFFRVACADGMIELSPAFSYNGQRLTTHHSSEQNGSVVTEHDIKEANHFASEMDAFADALLHQKPIQTPGEEGLADMRILAAMAQSIREQRPVRIDQG
ncbi:Gfo/Idh/MocA family oxidoreductase [Rhodopirellula sp. JC740]|uniref:Gfo/Idh/MocA family oxidoreductase n=1 Tax=Rhodopirellula halodulae TaxID=2894198 RepID=A0ABS8NNU5_9BACT|nr:Gfo/Idh/MocA family oxidoreductase [Rhodopirellula sp. JC740]MCC9645241.1 Gfo/Idh/MocA family oxidoreductase [Rhodopirellula sp. JC740]